MSNFGSSLAKRLREEIMPPVLTFGIVIVLWHVLVRAFDVAPFIVPGPGRVWQAAVERREALISGIGITAAGAFAGFTCSLVIGLLIAFIFAQSRWIQRSFYPYAIFLQTVPIVAIAPLVILWSGYGFRSIVVIAFILSLFPIITNATTGLTTVDRNLIELFELNNATRRQTLFKLRLPNSIPYLVTGAKVSSGLSVIGSIVGEFFTGQGTTGRGLGYLITLASSQIKTDFLFASIIASTLLGLVIFIIVNAVGQAVMSRWQD